MDLAAEGTHRRVARLIRRPFDGAGSGTGRDLPVLAGTVGALGEADLDAGFEVDQAGVGGNSIWGGGRFRLIPAAQPGNLERGDVQVRRGWVRQGWVKRERLLSGVALDLLPGWYDDWALVERERMRQRVLHALEALSQRLVRAGRFAEAVETALLAVGAEPLRESAQRALIEVHFAEGNWVEGWRNYQAYRDLLRRELGVEPSADLVALLQTTRDDRFA